MNVKLLDLRKKVGFYIQERGGGSSSRELFGLGGHYHYVQMNWVQNKVFDYCFGGKLTKYL
jgi:hypothetical protein